MTDETTQQTNSTTDQSPAATGRDAHRSGRSGDQRGRGGQQGAGDRGRRRRGRDNRPEEKSEFDSTIVDLARVTRVMAGGKRMSFRACVIIGDRKGRIGMGVKKGADVQLAIAKATEYAKKHIMTVPMVQGTIPHTIERSFKGAQVLLKPAKAGTGIIAGGTTRLVIELAGLQNIVAKSKGSGNKINNVTVTLQALRDLVTKEQIEQLKSR
jgi:small subunit ribosomal protein S5